MSTKVALITDYLGRFGSKQKSKTYRSGFDIEKSIEIFHKHNCQVKVFNFTNARVTQRKGHLLHFVYLF